MKKQAQLEKKFKNELECFNEYVITDKVIRKYETKTCQENGLTTAQFDVMMLLARFGRLSIKEILERTLSTSGNMTVVIKNMERDGFITRIQSPDDKRSFLIEITPKGENLVNDIVEEHLQNIATVFGRLEAKDIAEFKRLMTKLRG